MLAALLAKLHRPHIDVRKPYTEIEGNDCYSGRTYDERYVAAFINTHQLPCNSTTAFLTPALRNRNAVLTPDSNLVGRPAIVYTATLQLLTDVHEGRVDAATLLAETVRQLLLFRDERNQRIESLLSGLHALDEGQPLSAESIIALIEQHLKFKQTHVRGTSRLPVLIIAAAYQSVMDQLGERVLPLRGHNTADERTGAVGDIEITVTSSDNVITSYEMKSRLVTREDIDRALQKVYALNQRLHNYIFITTHPIDPLVQEYAQSMYAVTEGIEFVVLDCIGFLWHFLHLFYRSRMQFLNAYQSLLLAEPESAVSQPLKEVFLAMRQAAESSE